MLCESLRGRVKYNLTRYRKFHDQIHRFSVKVDNKERLSGYDGIYYINGYEKIEEILKIENNVQSRSSVNYGDSNYKKVGDINTYYENQAYYMTAVKGEPDVYVFLEAMYEYLNSNIVRSQNSSNYIIRMFAVLDRRTGKKALLEMKKDLVLIPDWLQFFYKLRFKAEKIL